MNRFSTYIPVRFIGNLLGAQDPSSLCRTVLEQWATRPPPQEHPNRCNNRNSPEISQTDHSSTADILWLSNPRSHAKQVLNNSLFNECLHEGKRGHESLTIKDSKKLPSTESRQRQSSARNAFLGTHNTQ